jgi:hypothetical protein
MVLHDAGNTNFGRSNPEYGNLRQRVKGTLCQACLSNPDLVRLGSAASIEANRFSLKDPGYERNVREIRNLYPHGLERPRQYRPPSYKHLVL